MTFKHAGSVRYLHYSPIALIFVLAGCQTAPEANSVLAEIPQPPEFESTATALPQSEQIAELKPEPVTQAARPQQMARASTRAFLPGVSTATTGAGDSTSPAQNDTAIVPFEEELQKQRKRIDLGLEREQREEEPVDNVVNLQF